MHESRIEDKLVERLKVHKHATSCELASELGLSHGTVRHLMVDIRRTYPNVVAEVGKGYEWVEQPDNSNNGLYDKTKVMIDKIISYVKSRGSATYADLMKEFKLSKNTVMRYVKYIKRTDRRFDVTQGAHSRITFREGKENSDLDGVSNDILNIIKDNPFIITPNICEAVNLSRGPVIWRLYNLQNSGLVLKTKSASYVYKDFVNGIDNVSRMSDNAIRCLKLLMVKGECTSDDFAGVTINLNCKSGMTKVTRNIVDNCDKVTVIKRGYRNIYLYDRSR